MIRTRKPAIAGSFYPGTKAALIKMIETIDAESAQPAHQEKYSFLIGGIVPHAGYIYSGTIAAPFFKILNQAKHHFETVVILHPNHYGKGPAIATDINDVWQTPLGEVPLDLELSEVIGLEKNAEAHRLEHSAEIMLPFLQYYLPAHFKILPVAISHIDYPTSLGLASKICAAAQKTNRKLLVIASSDFSHYVNPTQGKLLDDKAIVHILQPNAAEFYRIVIRHRLSICGYGPIMTLMEYARLVVKTLCVEILARGHSGEITGDDKVVNYNTILFYEPENS